MLKVLGTWVLVAIASSLLMARPAVAAQGSNGNLASAQWLAQNLERDDVLILDASPAKLYAAGHIPGAVSIDLFSYGGQEIAAEDMERRLQSWGVGAGRKIVIYDQGGTYLATRVFFDLFYLGFPAADLFVLDGGLAKWQEVGGRVTKEPTPAPKGGSFRIAKVRDDARVRLAEFLSASGNPEHNVLVEALDANYHFGESKFFDRAGHVPNSVMLPSEDFFHPDKTFKSAAELQTMMDYLGVRPEQQIHTYCGGGVAASVPFFALRFVLNYPKVKLYKESELEWLQDERGLPLWTFGAPFLKRDMNWLNAWGSRMMRIFGVTRLSVVDVRPAEKFAQGHVPFALNIPADVFKRNLSSPEKLSEILGPAGVNPAYEAVIVSEGGLNESSALVFLMLEWLGQKKVSVLMDSVDEWGLHGFPLTKEATAVGPRKSPQDMLSIVPTAYPARLRSDVVTDDRAGGKGLYPTVFIASGRTTPVRAPAGKVIHLPYTDLLESDGTPKAAKDIWKILVKAGVPRYGEIVCFSDDPGEAAVNYFILKLMGFPDVKVLVTRL